MITINKLNNAPRKIKSAAFSYFAEREIFFVRSERKESKLLNISRREATPVISSIILSFL